METTFIYTLSDPITKEVKWVGQTSNPKKRKNAHECDKRTNVYKKWMVNLRLNNLRPVLDVVDEVPQQEWVFWEQHYISLFKSWGCPLINKTHGGVGLTGVRYVMKDETRKKISVANTGKIPSEETKQKIKDSGVYDRASVNMKLNNPMKNPETVRRVVETQRPTKFRKPVAQIDKEGNIIKIWDCAIWAGKELKIDGARITKVCKKTYKEKTCGGFKWEYYNPEN